MRAHPKRSHLAAVAVAAVTLCSLAACGGSSGGGNSATKTATGGAITVVAHDIGFDVGTIDATPGPLKVTLVNNGAIQHTFKVDGTSFELKADGSKTVSGTVTLAKGTYKFECTIPGHASAGMKGKIVVA